MFDICHFAVKTCFHWLWTKKILQNEKPVCLYFFSEICYDFKNGRKYVIGDVFQRDGICCQCRAGGLVNCSLEKSCTQGTLNLQKH